MNTNANITTAVKPTSLLAKMASNYDIEPAKFHAMLKKTAFASCRNDEEFVAMCVVANAYNLNPLTKEIYAFPSKGGAVIPIVGIDGWAKIINAHPEFDGLEFEENAESCTAIIYRKDRSRPVKVTEWLAECNTHSAPWQSHPRRMLRHRALIQAARLAFGFSGVYDADEAREEQSIIPAEAEATATPKRKRATASEILAEDAEPVAETPAEAAQAEAESAIPTFE